MIERNVVEDDASVSIPSVSYREKYLLNSQTAYNKGVVQNAERCGCFHCGSSFPGSSVTVWLEEEDGDDTALCPYCGEDSVIIGTEDFPLSTALLTGLYLAWYEKEFEATKGEATYVPKYSDRADYMRKGVPFLIQCKGEVAVVGEIDLFPIEIFDDRWGNLHDNDVFEKAREEIVEVNKGATVSAKAYFDESGCYVAEFLDDEGARLPYEPWTGAQQNLLLDLTERYGDALEGVVVESGFIGKMKLFVEQ